MDRSGKIIESRITQVRLDRGAESISKKLLAQCRALVRSAAKLGLEVAADRAWGRRKNRPAPAVR